MINNEGWQAAVMISAGLLALSSAAAARQPVFPVMSDEAAIGRLEQAVAYIMSLDEQQVRDLVPVESGGIRFVDCPNCEAGVSDRGLFKWVPQKPYRIECEGCGEVYPDNPGYPDDQFVEVDAPQSVHRFWYYERPDGHRHYFRHHADYHRRPWLERQVRDLGRLYAATGDQAYAHRAAVILLRFAEVYPGYAYIYDFPFRPVRFEPYTNNRIEGVVEYRTARWAWWAFSDISVLMLQGYEPLRDWPGLAEMAGGRAVEMIEQDFFTNMVEFVLGLEESYVNVSPRIWISSALAGRVLDRPDWVHEAMRRFERMLQDRFLYDGHWFETSPSYGQQVVGMFGQFLEAVQGYSDPPGYRDPVDGRRFDDLDLARQVPQYELARQALLKVRFPDGRILPVNDTWAIQPARTTFYAPRERMEPVLMPGLGVAVLGAGEGEDQFHAYLNFTAGRHHKQRDALAIGLFAFGKELLPDLGYTHSRYRSWANSTMSHNTVAVDGREGDFDPQHTGHRLVEFVADGRGFSLAAAESTAAYPHVQRYRRTLVAVGQNSRDAYLIDIFEVTGGRQHDWIVHGPADEDSRADLEGVDLRPFEGTLMNDGVEFERPTGEYDHPGHDATFGFIRDLKRGEAEAEQVVLDVRLADSPQIGTRTIVAVEPETQVYVGQSPSIRRAEERDDRVDDYHMPSFIVRRRAEDGELRSIFVAVHEPVNGQPKVQSLRREVREDVLVATIRRGDGAEDVLTLATTEQAEATGRYSLVRTADGRATVETHFIGPPRPLADEAEQGRTPGHRGRVLAFGRDGGERGRGWFEVAEVIDPASAAMLMIRFEDDTVRAFNIMAVERGDGRSRVYVREDPGFEITDGQRHLRSFPQRSIDGTQVRYELAGRAHYYRHSD